MGVSANGLEMDLHRVCVYFLCGW